MKGTSKVIMGATLVMVVILAIVLGLVLVLLAELYCSMLIRRRRKPRLTTTSATATASNTPANDSSSSPSHPLQDQILSPKPLRSFYAHGVLDAPRSFLYPAVVDDDKEVNLVDIEKQHTQQPLDAAWSPPLSPPFIISLNPPKPTDKITHQRGGITTGYIDAEHLVYISNPMYDDKGGRGSRVDTPFETPDTSPSRLEGDGFSGEEVEECSLASSSPDSWVVRKTPPLTPMRELPPEGCSVSLKDARSLATSSDSNSNKDDDRLSSSSSGSPCTSPSW